MTARLAGLSLVAIGSAGAGLAYAQAAPTTGVVAGQILTLVIGMAVVLGAIGGAAWLLKRYAPRSYGSAGVLRVLGGVAVGPRERIVLIEIGGTWLVVGVASGSVSLLHQMPRMAEDEHSERPLPPSSTFASWLKQKIEKRNEG